MPTALPQMAAMLKPLPPTDYDRSCLARTRPVDRRGYDRRRSVADVDGSIHIARCDDNTLGDRRMPRRATSASQPPALCLTTYAARPIPERVPMAKKRTCARRDRAKMAIVIPDGDAVSAGDGWQQRGATEPARWGGALPLSPDVDGRSPGVHGRRSRAKNHPAVGHRDRPKSGKEHKYLCTQAVVPPRVRYLVAGDMTGRKASHLFASAAYLWTTFSG